MDVPRKRTRNQHLCELETETQQWTRQKPQQRRAKSQEKKEDSTTSVCHTKSLSCCDVRNESQACLDTVFMNVIYEIVDIPPLPLRAL